MHVENACRYVHVKFGTKLQKYVPYTKMTINIRNGRVLFTV
jgi:hypothetical protein